MIMGVKPGCSPAQYNRTLQGWKIVEQQQTATTTTNICCGRPRTMNYQADIAGPTWKEVKTDASRMTGNSETMYF